MRAEEEIVRKSGAGTGTEDGVVVEGGGDISVGGPDVSTALALNLGCCLGLPLLDGCRNKWTIKLKDLLQNNNNINQIQAPSFWKDLNR